MQVPVRLQRRIAFDRSCRGVSWRLLCLRERSWKSVLLLETADPELVERSLRVRLGPQADLARRGDGVILDVEVLLAVEEALDVVARHLDLERVPLAGRDRDVGVLELGAA